MATEQEALHLGIDIPVDEAIDDLTRLGKDGAKALRLIDKTAKAYTKTQDKVRKGVTGSSGLLAGVKRLASAYQDYGKKVTRWNTAIAREQAKLAKANDSERDGIRKKLEDLKQLRKERMKEMKGEHSKGAMEFLGGAKKMGSSGVKAGKGFFKAGSHLLKKDFENAAQHAAKAIGDAMSSSKTLGKGFKKAGSTFWKYGGKKFDESRKKWGAGGVKNKLGSVKDMGLAGVSAAVGGISKAMAPLLKMIGQMGPLLSMASGAIAAIVKLMVDAEAQAKEMNKQILQVAGSSNQFYKFSQKGDVALQDMSDMLRNIRDDATSLDNIGWGINKEDHMAVLTTLAQEGVALDQLGTQFDAVGKDADLAAVHAKSFGGVVQVAVAYSRQFGVSLQELTQFQGEMMTDMGESLAGVQKAFHMMTAGAHESGIATNKFFGIIRGLSADLNLYNTRMEDAVHTLTLLGKAMSPRNAAKFMQTATQGLKGMGRVERFKANLLGGGKMGAQVKKDLQRKSGSVAEQINAAGGKVNKGDILDPSKKLTDLMQGVPEQMQGEFKEAIISMRTDQKMAGKGQFGASMAGRNLGPGAALQAMKDSLKIAGGGKLADRRGDVGTEMLAESLGISEDQLDQMTKFEASVDEQRDTLKNQLKKGGADADGAMAALKKAGIDASKIDSASYDEILDTLDETQKKALQDSGKEIDFAKRTSEFTSTISDKIEALMQWLMNQLYNVMTDIYDALSDLADKFGAGDADARKMTKLQLQAQKGGNKELMEMANKATSPEDLKKAILESQAGRAQKLADPTELYKKQESLQEQLSKTQDENEKKKLVAELAATKQSYNAAVDQRAEMEKAIDAQLGGGHTGGMGDKILGALPGLDSKNSLRADRFGSAANGVIGGKESAAVQDALKDGKSLVEAMGSAHLTDQEQLKMLDKLQSQLSPEQLIAISSKATAKTGATPPAAEVKQAIAQATGGGGTPTTTGGPPPAVAQAQTAAATQTLATTADDSIDQQNNMIGSLEGIQQTLWSKGIKINKSFMRSEFWKQGQDAVLDANRQALFEYFLYSKMDPDKVAEGLKNKSFTAQDFYGSGSVVSRAMTGDKLPGMAAGGVVPEPKSPDSVFVAAKPGETILPRGAGSGGAINIPINVNAGPGGQELANMMKSAAMSVVAEWQRKQRYT